MDILRAMLPVILVSIVVVYRIHTTKKKANKKETDKTEETYLTEGMTIGMCLGTAVGIALNMENIAIGMSMGMLFGMLVGMASKNSIELKKRWKLLFHRFLFYCVVYLS